MVVGVAVAVRSLFSYSLIIHGQECMYYFQKTSDVGFVRLAGLIDRLLMLNWLWSDDGDGSIGFVLLRRTALTLMNVQSDGDDSEVSRDRKIDV